MKYDLKEYFFLWVQYIKYKIKKLKNLTVDVPDGDDTDMFTAFNLSLENALKWRYL